MLTIRLSRGGTKKKPFYRVVVIENEKKLGGEPVEILGFWNPKENSIKINKDQVKAWLQKGAKPTEKVKKLLEK